MEQRLTVFAKSGDPIAEPGVSGAPRRPAWGGPIGPPRFWQPGQLTVQARSSEFQFTRRILNGGGRMPAGGRKLTGTAARLFAQLIELGNQQAELRLEAGK